MLSMLSLMQREKRADLHLSRNGEIVQGEHPIYFIHLEKKINLMLKYFYLKTGY